MTHKGEIRYNEIGEIPLFTDCYKRNVTTLTQFEIGPTHRHGGQHGDHHRPGAGSEQWRLR
jgi:hypothetical protein